ncbi:GNAT family N-acetyltransferase [Domibacillus iocasae]|uniref:Aminoglycoside adenylyltransferase n=1 Tax=Domibacillus iocasae TaxID=1714016 RepID=A0A1E7DU17_9BACI|nr:GNAT family protein [Domibacillus iocasae]OES46572.1 aminoglycoside adenylyltransferase [Domibacillus iocasae]
MIQLAYFTRNDFIQLMNWIPSEAFMVQWAGTGFTFPLHTHQLEQYIKEANHPASDTFVYKAIHTETGRVVGHVSLKVDRRNESARIGKMLVGDESMRGLGIGYHVIEAVTALAFHAFKLHRVSLGVFDFNDAAIACYEKAGFKKEGLLRDARKAGKEYWSLWEMSLLEEEWKKRSQ